MPESFVQGPPDSSGKRVRAAQTTQGGNAVHTPYTRIEPQGGPDSVAFMGTATNRATQEWTSLQSVPVPAGFIAQPLAFRALSATAGYGARAVYFRELGRINLVTGTYTDTGKTAATGSHFQGITIVLPAAITTATTLTVSFVDDQGVARTLTQALALNAPAGTRFEPALPARTDAFGRATTPVAGVRDVTNVTRNTASTAEAVIYGYDVISYVRTVAANTVYNEQIDPHLWALIAGDILSVESNSYATAVAAILQERQLIYQLTEV